MDASTGVTIEAVDGPAGRKRFIAAARPAFEGDPHYVPPLNIEVGSRLDPKANPTLKDADHQLWVATRNGRDVGRIGALINPMHLRTHNDGAAHFGFLDAIDDPAVFRLLLSTAETWARARGMTRIGGPYHFSVNEEVGMLVDGFDAPPYFMMPHGREWYGRHTEAAGYAKAMDMFALSYRNVVNFIPEKRQRFVDRALSNPKVRLRHVDFSRFREEVATAVEIFNDAWSDNWGFIPFTEANAAHMASELRPIIEKHNFMICEYDGAPAAFGLVFPNINEAIRDFDGRLFPFNWAKLLYRLKVKGLSQARMPLMGVRKKFQGKPLGPAFAYKMIDIMNRDNISRGLKSSELSWILETNTPMLNMLTEMGGEIYKTYRVYEKPL
ncbi:MAG: dATP pyrophosphohydrolase [Alphaproteobacteria bacterium]|nr:dATP pyrophosphohydrolase [Alphaproteobacteria bacterium]